MPDVMSKGVIRSNTRWADEVDEVDEVSTTQATGQIQWPDPSRNRARACTRQNRNRTRINGPVIDQHHSFDRHVNHVSESGSGTPTTSCSKEGEQETRASGYQYQVASHLKKLDTIDPLRVIKISNIAFLCLKSDLILREALSPFANVEEILLARRQGAGTTAKEHHGRSKYRPRASKFCFVVMSSPEEAAEILDQLGGEVRVGEATIVMEPFVRRASVPCSSEETSSITGSPYSSEASSSCAEYEPLV